MKETFVYLINILKDHRKEVLGTTAATEWAEIKEQEHLMAIDEYKHFIHLGDNALRKELKRVYKAILQEIDKETELHGMGTEKSYRLACQVEYCCKLMNELKGKVVLPDPIEKK